MPGDSCAASSRVGLVSRRREQKRRLDVNVATTTVGPCVSDGEPKGVRVVDLSFWWLLPVAVVIATVANGAGIGGATFFSPLFIIGLGLEPATAIGVALGTEVFGFASGVYAHHRAGAIDWKIVRILVSVSVPAAVAGSLLAGAAPETLLKLVLAIGLGVVATILIRHHDPAREDGRIAAGAGVVEPAFSSRVLLTDDGAVDFHVCDPKIGRTGAGIGGLFVGLISTGLGEANSFTLVKRCRIPSRVAIAVSVATVAITALAASATHAIAFATNPDADHAQIGSMLMFTIPGVVVGGQIGPRVLSGMSEGTLVRALGWLFLGVALLTTWEAFVR